VSFSNGEEYFQAAREMNGKYIGSHPVLIKKSMTEIRPTVHKNKHKGKNGKGGKGGGGSYSANDRTGAGVQKKTPKTINGHKVLA
jgi:hypothetical protein